MTSRFSNYKKTSYFLEPLRFIFGVLCLGMMMCCSCIGAAEQSTNVKPVATEADKVALPQDGLVFYAPFDESLKPSVGTPSEVAGQNGDFAFVPGQTGKSIRTGNKDSLLMYNGSALNGEEGTVSLWVRPEWTLDSSDFHLFWSLISDGRFTLYRHGYGKSLAFLVQGANATNAEPLVLMTPDKLLKPKEWNNLTATWTAGEVRFFVNGELAKEVSDVTLKLPRISDSTVFMVGDYYSPGYGTQAGLAGQPDTDIDELRIYNRSLSEREIKTLAGKTTEIMKAPELPRVVVPKTNQPPVINGAFSFDEWKGAAGFSGYFDIVTGKLSDKQTSVLLTYDDTNLYVATFAPVVLGATMQSKATERDSDVFRDDCLEIYLDPDNKRATKHGFQFIGNANGAILDSKHNDFGWNGQWNYKATLQNNWRGLGLSYWVTELSIPFSDLGRNAPADGEQWAANFARTWIAGQNASTSWAWVNSTSYFTPERFGTLEFREKAPAFQWTDLRDVMLGTPVFDGTLQSEKPVELTVGSAASEASVVKKPLNPSPVKAEKWSVTTSLTGSAQSTLRVEARDADRILYTAELPYEIEVQPLRVFVSPVPSQKRLYVQVDPFQFRRQWAEGWSIDVEIKDKTNKVLAQQNVKRYAPPFAVAQFDLGALPVGSYQVVTTLQDGAKKQLAKLTTPFVKPELPVWFENKIGVTDRVLKPWTPIVATPTDLSMWGRKYSFGNHAFPTQITSQNTPLLQSPIRLMLNGQALPAASSVKSAEKTPAKVVQKGLSTTGKWNVDWQKTSEFDGIVWYEMTVKPQAAGAQTLDSLVLEVPMRKETSTLYASIVDSSTVPDHWQSTWKQGVWVGNEQMGLNWFAESDQHWSLADPKRALTIDRTAAGTTLRINFVTKPKVVNGAITYRFGLLATPSRPMPKNWRAWQFSAGTEGTTIHTEPEKPNMALSWWMNWSPLISAPLNVDTARAKSVIESFHRNGAKAIPYNALVVLNEAVPEFPYFRSEWMMQPQRSAGGEGTPQQTWFVSVNSSYQDYMIYALRELVRTHGWDGLYFDFDGGALADSNAFHGSGYVDEKGERHPTYDVMAVRNFHKRLWAMAQEELKTDEPPIYVHNSATVAPYLHTFTNMWLNGEEFESTPKVHDDYTKVLTRDRFRAEFVGSKFGAASFLLPELNHLQIAWLNAPEGPGREAARLHFQKAIDTMLLYPVVHGTLIYPAWLDMEYLKPIYEARRSLDIGTARFYGYWENADLVKLTQGGGPANKDVVASIYAQDNRFQLVLGNWTTETQNVTADLAMEKISPKLNVAQAKLKNRFKEGEATRKGNQIQLTVPPKSIRIVEIGP